MIRFWVSRSVLVSLQEVFWQLFNARVNFEGLVDMANDVYGDPRGFLMFDELSLCVSGAGLRIQAVLTLDEYIMFLDEDGEVSKQVASKPRRLRSAFITSVAGLQYDVLPEVIGAQMGRNMLARFTAIATQEYRGLEEVDPDSIDADRSATSSHLRDVFCQAVEQSRTDGAARVHATGEDVSRLLTSAFNMMLRAAQRYGDNTDPLVKWVRKADEFLLTQLAGVDLEVQSDISSLNPRYRWVSDSMPSIYAFATVSAVCRSIVDMRCIMNEATFRTSKVSQLQVSEPSAAPAVLAPQVSVQDAVVATILHHGESLSRKDLRDKLRKTTALKNAGWATYVAILHCWEILREAGLAEHADPDAAGNTLYRLIAEDRLDSGKQDLAKSMRECWRSDGKPGAAGANLVKMPAPSAPAGAQLPKLATCAYKRRRVEKRE